MARPTLPRPPSDRYATGGEVARARLPDPGEPPGNATSTDVRQTGWRSEIGAGITAVVTAAILVVVGGVLGLTTGLLFLAGVGGALTGLVLAGSPRSRARLRLAAIALAFGAVVVGAVGAWLVARAEGGSLGLLDYLWAVTGLLVPAQIVVAGLAAAWGVGAGPIRS